MVHRCISALAGDWLVRNLKAVGIIDRDFHTDEYLATLPSGLVALPLHEVESLYCLPAVVAAVAAHLQKCFDAGDYLTCLRESVTVPERHKVVLERWKQRIEPRLIAVVAKVHARQDPLETIVAALAQTFDPASWDFNAAELLREEKERVETAATVGDVEGLLRLLPGKGRLAAAAQYVGLHVDAYVHLINQSLRGADGLDTVGAAVDTALAPHLPTSRTGEAGNRFCFSTGHPGVAQHEGV
jgi:hypothetical protein